MHFRFFRFMYSIFVTNSIVSRRERGRERKREGERENLDVWKWSEVDNAMVGEMQWLAQFSDAIQVNWMDAIP